MLWEAAIAPCDLRVDFVEPTVSIHKPLFFSMDGNVVGRHRKGDKENNT